MKLESITVENYRQFEKAELTFDEGITILAGANNSGKTSLINLIKNIFVDDKLNYNMSDIPAKNMREWVYPIFQKFFRDRKTEENVEKDLLNVVIPKEETDSTHLMKMTTVKIHVSYNPDMDDITPTVEELYSWKETGGNIIEDLIYVCFQTKDDGYARTLEEAMINKYFDMDVSKCYKKSDWKEKRKDSELKFSIPRMKNKKEIADDD